MTAPQPRSRSSATVLGPGLITANADDDDGGILTYARAIRRLEHAGFVRRSRYADDKRSFVIEPTAASRALRSQVEEVWKELEDAAVGGVSEDERGTILRVLEELEKRLTQTAAELWF